MVEVEETRRRLPSWMLDVSTADHIEKSDKIDEVQVQGIVTSKAKRRRKNAEPPQEDEAAEAVSDDVLGPVKRRKMKFNDKDEECDTESGLQKNGNNAARRKTRKSTIRSKLKAVDSVSGDSRCSKDVEILSLIHDDSKHTSNSFRKKKNSGVKRKARGSTSVRFEGSKENIEMLSPIDSGDELTAEDLVRFAKEYVKACKDMEQPESSSVEHGLERPFSATDSHRNMYEGSLNSNNSNDRSTTCGTTKNESAVCLGNEHTLINVSNTDGSAIDMLDLYLGPLLRKPLEEKRTEYITKDVTFASDSGKQKCKNVREERPPTSKKKKSSLRDKVGLFID